MLALLIPVALIGFVLAYSGHKESRVTAIDTFNAFLQANQAPPAFVAQLAHDEALSIGDAALARSIAETFLAPSTQQTAPQVGATALEYGLAETAATDLVPMTSPIPNVSNDEWNAFAQALVRQAPTYDSPRRVGRYAACKSRLAEIGIDPATILGSANAQDMALCADLADAYRHLRESGELAKYVGARITIPDADAPSTISLSGLLGVASVAGLEDVIGWLTSESDRKRFPNTTNLFLRTNGMF